MLRCVFIAFAMLEKLCVIAELVRRTQLTFSTVIGLCSQD